MNTKNQKPAACSQEVAEVEFERFADAMDLDVNMSKMSEDDRQSFEPMKRRVVEAIIAGSVTINEKGEPVFRPAKSEPAEIVFHEPKGSALMAMDARKKGQDVAKLYALMGEITGLPAVTFANMLNRDLKIAQAIVTLFLA